MKNAYITDIGIKSVQNNFMMKFSSSHAISLIAQTYINLNMEFWNSSRVYEHCVGNTCRNTYKNAISDCEMVFEEKWLRKMGDSLGHSLVQRWLSKISRIRSTFIQNIHHWKSNDYLSSSPPVTFNPYPGFFWTITERVFWKKTRFITGDVTVEI